MSFSLIQLLLHLLESAAEARMQVSSGASVLAASSFLSVEVVASDVGFFVVFFFSSVVGGSVEDPGPVVVKKLVSFPQFGWRSRVADGDGF